MDFFFSEKSSNNLKSLERLGLSRAVSRELISESRNGNFTNIGSNYLKNSNRNSNTQGRDISTTHSPNSHNKK